VAILNGFGRSLGDSIIGLQALAAALHARAVSRPPVLFRLPGLSPIVAGAYAAAADLAEVRTLAWDDATPERPFPPAAAFARRIDLRDFAFDPAFRGVAMIDYFLRHLGLDPAAVPPALRRNAWLAPRLSPPRPDLPRGYILVCPRASMALRSMPEEVHAAILAALAAAGEPAVTQGEPRDGAIAFPQAEDFAGLCGLVAHARAVISADTAMPHLADAYGVPCLALFTTHRPDGRGRADPLSRALRFPPDLPEALEFARAPADVDAARAAWFAAGADFPWLAPALADLLARGARAK
jgi:hypothetical protein